MTGARTRAEVAVLPQVPAATAELAQPAFGDVVLHADELHSRAFNDANGRGGRVEKAESIADLQRARIAVSANPRGVTIRFQQLGFLREVHPITSRLGGWLHTAKREPRRATILQGIQRRAEGAVGIERHEPLLSFAVEAREDQRSFRRFDLDPIARFVELRDTPLHATTRITVQRGPFKREMAAIHEP